MDQIVDSQVGAGTQAPQSPFLTLNEAAALLGRGGRRPSIPTLWRWCRHGCRGVRLAYMKMGRELRISPAAIEAFGRALAAADREPKPAKSTLPVRAKASPARRARELEAVRARLQARGFIIGGSGSEKEGA